LIAGACDDGDDDSVPSATVTPAADTEPTATVDLRGSTITVYSGRREELVDPIVDRFTDATGIKVQVRYGSNAGLIGTIFEEGSNSPADVFFGSDPGALGAISDRLITLPESILGLVDAPFRSQEGRWVGFSGRARVIVYNTENVTEDGLPASIFDFTDLAWKGRIGWAPTNGSFQTMVTAIRLMEGEERARQWLRSIKANDPGVYANNVAIVEAVGNGEMDVGFVNHYYLHRFLAEQGESFPARNYYLKGGDPGAVVLVAGAGILDASDDTAAAEKFLEFMLSPEAQQHYANENFEYPLVEGVQTGAALPPISSIEVPDIDLSGLSDLEGTLQLLRETGVIP
jgi:iron(III) transport system substrate-binding protein